MALTVPRVVSSPTVHDAVKPRPVSVSLSDSALVGVALNIRGVDACAIQLLSRTRLIALLSSQLAAPNAPADTLLTFTRELLRHWRHNAIPGYQLRSLLRAASACFPPHEVNSLKLLALSCALSPPPTPRASPGLGRLPAFGHTFHANVIAKVADELAEWSSLEEYAFFSYVRSRELVKQAWQTPKREKRSPNICALVNHFNRLSLWIAAEILGARDDDRQVRVGRVHVAMGVLKRALSLRAYNTAMALFAGLNHGSVQRLKRMWMGVSSENLKFFSETEALLSHVGNYSRLTQEVASVPVGTHVMPYVGAALKDLALIHLGNGNFQEKGQVNFEKLRMLGRRLYELLRHQQTRFAHTWPMSSSTWAQALMRPDLPSEEELWHLSAMIEPKLYIPATDNAPARPFWQFSPDEVASYLAASGLGAYAPFFQKHAICGADALSLTDAELTLIGLSDPISRTKVLSALADVLIEHGTKHPGGAMAHSSSSSSSGSAFDLSSPAAGARLSTKSGSTLIPSSTLTTRRRALRLKCECDGETRILRFEDGPPTSASHVARQGAHLFGIAPSDAPTLDERHLRTLLKRNQKLQFFRPHTPRETPVDVSRVARGT